VLFANMKMPYTEALLNSIPKLDDPATPGSTPSRPPAGPRQPAEGLPLRPALLVRQDRCLEEEPPLTVAEHPEHFYACWYPVGSRPVHRRTQPTTRQRRKGRKPTDGRHRQGTPPRDDHDVLLRVEDLVVEFPVGRTGLKVHAVSGISFDVLRGETLGLVGESRLRQEHHRQGAHAAAAPHQRLGRVRGHRAHLAVRRPDARRPAPACR
jgi:peptide/nickel transport system ATP-binding protein